MKDLIVENIRIDLAKTGYNLVDTLSLTLRSGEIVGIVGESGCGKSITALTIMGLLPKDDFHVQGHIMLQGTVDLLSSGERQLSSIRGNDIAMIFQDAMSALNPAYSVGWQISEMIRLHQNVNKQQAHDLALKMLADVNLPATEGTYQSYPHQLSGGMRQRVMIAMAMANDPDFLIADEPTTALDVTVQAQILQLIDRLRATNNTGVLFISHDLGVIGELCDRVLVMYAGQLVEKGDSKEVLSNPLHPYTRGLLFSQPNNLASQKRLPTICGTVPGISDYPKGCRFAPRCPYAEAACGQAFIPLSAARRHETSCWKQEVCSCF